VLTARHRAQHGAREGDDVVFDSKDEEVSQYSSPTLMTAGSARSPRSTGLRKVDTAASVIFDVLQRITTVYRIASSISGIDTLIPPVND